MKLRTNKDPNFLARTVMGGIILRSKDDPAGRRTNKRGHPNDRLIRQTVSGLYLRQEEGDIATIGGYGLEWSETYDAGFFTESFRQGAFADSLDAVRLKVGHDYRSIALARSPRTMEVDEDDTGLKFEASLDLRSPDALSLYVAIDRRDVDKMSIGFFPEEEVVIREEDEPPHYEVIRAILFEISAVDFPAYESSSVEPRKAVVLGDKERQIRDERRKYQEKLFPIHSNGGCTRWTV